MRLGPICIVAVCGSWFEANAKPAEMASLAPSIAELLKHGDVAASSAASRALDNLIYVPKSAAESLLSAIELADGNARRSAPLHCASSTRVSM